MQPDEPDGKEDRRSWIYLSIAAGIVIVLLLAVLLYHRNTTPPTLEELHQKNLAGKLKPSQGYVYNGFSFVSYTGSWFTQITKDGKVYSIPLHFSPRDVANISFEGKLDPNFGTEPIYMTFDPTSPGLGYIAGAWGELGVSLTQVFGISPHQACTVNETVACQDLPIGECDLNGSVIVYRIGPDPKITLQGNCAIIEGNGAGLFQATDRLLLVLFGIMQP